MAIDVTADGLSFVNERVVAEMGNRPRPAGRKRKRDDGGDHERRRVWQVAPEQGSPELWAKLDANQAATWHALLGLTSTTGWAGANPETKGDANSGRANMAGGRLTGLARLANEGDR